MYKAKFIDADGNVFLLDEANNIVFDIEGLSGVSVDHTMAQGVQQIGETISARSVRSKTLIVSGVIFRNIDATKREMRKSFAPFVSGQLVFNDRYYINVSVKSAPTFSPILDRGTFSMQLLAPYPFFKELTESVGDIGNAVKAFRFPVNYSTPHTFATRSKGRYVNVINDGDVETDFVAYITTTSVSVNPTLTNLTTFEFLRINRTINAGETIKVCWDDDGVLRVDLIDANGNATDIFADLDESSNLFSLHRGDNLLSASDNTEVQTLVVTVKFNPVVVGVFDEY